MYVITSLERTRYHRMKSSITKEYRKHRSVFPRQLLEGSLLQETSLHIRAAHAAVDIAREQTVTRTQDVVTLPRFSRCHTARSTPEPVTSISRGPLRHFRAESARIDGLNRASSTCGCTCLGSAVDATVIVTLRFTGI